ncbi:MAG TPA: hypothetical protein VKS21_02825 [Spirochaetota bacterium]|nr:hypothetical protein [Spirochaetota bacterium]
MPENNPNYRHALKKFKKRDYNAAEIFFLKAAPRNQNTAWIYYYLTLTAIKLKKYNDAAIYINRSLEQEPGNVRFLMSSAYVDLFLNKKSHAIYKYSKILNLGSKKRKVKSILNQLKIEQSPAMLLKKNINYFLYGWPYGFLPANIFYIITAAGLVLAAAVLFIPDQLHFRQNKNFSIINYSSNVIYTNTAFIKNRGNVKNVNEIYLFKDLKPGSKKLSSRQLVQLFNKMKKSITDRRINDAIYINNKILHSDVNPFIKEKFNILAKCIPKPNFKDFKNSVAVAELADSKLFKNFYIKFKGIVSAIKFKKQDTIFNFSVLQDGKIAHTVEVIIHNKTLRSLHENDRCQIMARYRLFHKHKKKMIFEGLVIKKL